MEEVVGGATDRDWLLVNNYVKSEVECVGVERADGHREGWGNM